jgi:hypothetical protein
MTAAGLATPDISILSDEFLAEVRESDKKNLAIGALRKLINGEAKTLCNFGPLSAPSRLNGTRTPTNPLSLCPIRGRPFVPKPRQLDNFGASCRLPIGQDLFATLCGKIDY